METAGLVAVLIEEPMVDAQVYSGAPRAALHPVLLGRHAHQAVGLGQGGFACQRTVENAKHGQLCVTVYGDGTWCMWHSAGPECSQLLIRSCAGRAGVGVHPDLRGTLALCHAVRVQP